MSLEDFIKKWKGKPVDFDGIYPNQCMDLMHQYVYEVLDITDKSVLASPSAYTVYTNFNQPDLFRKIRNTISAVPEPGDIIIWGQKVGTHGHIAIVVSADTNYFESFDANWPPGSLPHIEPHDYVGVLGWLRPIDSCLEWKNKAVYEKKEKEKYKAEARAFRVTDIIQKEEISTLTKNLEGLTGLYQKLIEEDKIEDEDYKQALKNFDVLAKNYKTQVDTNFELDKKNRELTTENEGARSEIDRLTSHKFTFRESFIFMIRSLIGGGRNNG